MHKCNQTVVAYKMIYNTYITHLRTCWSPADLWATRCKHNSAMCCRLRWITTSCEFFHFHAACLKQRQKYPREEHKHIHSHFTHWTFCVHDSFAQMSTCIRVCVCVCLRAHFPGSPPVPPPLAKTLLYKEDNLCTLTLYFHSSLINTYSITTCEPPRFILSNPTVPSVTNVHKILLIPAPLVEIVHYSKNNGTLKLLNIYLVSYVEEGVVRLCQLFWCY